LILLRAMQINGQSAPDLFCTDASYIDWDVACWKSDVGTPLIKNWSKLAGRSIEDTCHHSVHWFAWLEFGVLRTCLASLKSIILFLSGGNNLIRLH